MAQFKLSINARLDILWEDQIYKCTIQDLTEDEIIINIPVVDGSYLTLNKDDELEQISYDNNGNVFSYKSKVLGRISENNIPYYKLSKPYDIKKIQRRDYVRVNIVQIVTYIKEESLKRDLELEGMKSALLLDLSGGGMRIKMKDDLGFGDSIITKLIYQEQNILIKGKVIRKDKTDDKKYIYGIKFEDIDTSTREKIIRTVFTIMRKQRELF